MSNQRVISKVLSSGNGSSRAVLLVLALALLALLSSCGYGNNNQTLKVTCPGATGNFSKASLPAASQWTYELSGWFISSATNLYTPYVTAGTFTADGNGNITGFDDFFGGTFNGTYTISGNGTGQMIITLTSGPNSGVGLTWAITLSNTSPGSVYLIEADTALNASGTAYQQTTSAFSAAPNGTFVFHTHVLPGGTGLAGSAASVGVMTVNAGTIAVLNEDVLLGGLAPSQRTLGNGVFTAPDNTGLGTLTLLDSQGLTTTFDYFVIDAGRYLLFETDSTNGGLGLGRMEAQSAPSGGFTNASLTGGFVFGSRGDTATSGATGINSVGQFTSDGAGNFTSGSYDTVRDGSASLGGSIVAGAQSAYTVAANGRTQVSFNANGTVVQATLYLVSNARGFFLVSDTTNTRVEDGTLEAQVGTSFSGSNFTGQYAFVMGGATNQPLDRTGTLTSDGNGNLGLAEVANFGGSVNVPGCLAGTYTVATNGRVAASVNTLSGNLVFYLVSPNKAYMLQGDSATQMFGGAVVQASPVADPPGGF